MIEVVDLTFEKEDQYINETENSIEIKASVLFVKKLARGVLDGCKENIDEKGVFGFVKALPEYAKGAYEWTKTGPNIFKL